MLDIKEDKKLVYPTQEINLCLMITNKYSTGTLFY